MALVCYEHNFIFLKTYKTAGTSVEMALEPLCVPPGTEIVEHHPVIKTRYGIVGRRGPATKDGGGGLNKIKRRFEWWGHMGALGVRLRVGKKR